MFNANLSTFPTKTNVNRSRTYKLITIVITLYLLCSCSGSSEPETTAQKPPVPTELLAESDKLFDQRQDLSKLKEAIAKLVKARRENAKNFEVEWRLSKYNYYLGRHSQDAKEQEKALEDGKAMGKLAMKTDPSKPDGHFWFAANIGEQSNRNPIIVGTGSIGEIREAMNKVIEIQPNYEMASAYDVLGQLEIGSIILGGSVEKGIEYFEKGIELEKYNGETRVHLAEAYLKVDRNADAKKQLDFVIQMKPNPAYLPEYAQQVERAKKLLETRF